MNLVVTKEVIVNEEVDPPQEAANEGREIELMDCIVTAVVGVSVGPPSVGIKKSSRLKTCLNASALASLSLLA
jgi:hypothetical protein